MGTRRPVAMEQAVAAVHAKDTLAVPLGPGQPVSFLHALAARDDWEDLQLGGALLVDLFEVCTRPGVRVTSGFFGPAERYLRDVGADIDFLPADFPTPDFPTPDFSASDFSATVFPATAPPATDFSAAIFLATAVFLVTALFAPAFFATAFVATAFFAALFLPAAFTAAAFCPSPPPPEATVDLPDADCCTAVFFATMAAPLHIL